MEREIIQLSYSLNMMTTSKSAAEICRILLTLESVKSAVIEKGTGMLSPSFIKLEVDTKNLTTNDIFLLGALVGAKETGLFIGYS